VGGAGGAAGAARPLLAMRPFFEPAKLSTAAAAVLPTLVCDNHRASTATGEASAAGAASPPPSAPSSVAAELVEVGPRRAAARASPAGSKPDDSRASRAAGTA
jgi:hypothetical protein